MNIFQNNSSKLTVWKAEYLSDFDPEMDVHGAQVGEIKKKENVIPSPLDSQEIVTKILQSFSYMGMGQTWLCTPNMS